LAGVEEENEADAEAPNGLAPNPGDPPVLPKRELFAPTLPPKPAVPPIPGLTPNPVPNPLPNGAPPPMVDGVPNPEPMKGLPPPPEVLPNGLDGAGLDAKGYPPTLPKVEGAGDATKGEEAVGGNVGGKEETPGLELKVLGETPEPDR